MREFIEILSSDYSLSLLKKKVGMLKEISSHQLLVKLMDIIVAVSEKRELIVEDNNEIEKIKKMGKDEDNIYLLIFFQTVDRWR